MPNVQIRVRVDAPESSARQVRAWDDLVQTAADGTWTADFVPATAQSLTIIFYRNYSPPEAVVVSQTDPGFEELTNLTASFQLSSASK